ncbi:hypothetical protein EUTSA_v10005244mg [Eutrema salsugineum]|uniref:Uncharacterized protein n=1 Tax=Eutrema salsugineum TaxID=72664 RepID=V4KJ64_EUTSA|nr:hypothetical protein EUTSA_v10005244mg [Eutrema salsugineum]
MERKTKTGEKVWAILQLFANTQLCSKRNPTKHKTAIEQKKKKTLKSKKQRESKKMSCFFFLLALVQI